MTVFQNIDKKLKELQNEVESQSTKEPMARIYAARGLEQTARAIQAPGLIYAKQRLFPIENVCYLMAGEMGLLHAIVHHEGNSVDSNQLAQQLHCNEDLISRVELLFPIAGKMPSFLEAVRSEKANGSSQLNPFEFTYGKPMFEYFRSNSQHKEAFDNFMAGRRKSVRQPWFQTFPIAQIYQAGTTTQTRESVFIVDIGGGSGHDLVDLKNAVPNLQGRCILQDLPETLSSIDRPLSNIEKVPLNFFEQEPVKGAQFYFMRNIIHDWSDEASKRILSNVGASMTRGHSKILIEELVLPNIGASWVEASCDILMFLMPAGAERTQRQWETLLDSVGMKINKIWRGPPSAESIIEAELK
ncbi:MAG: hypothetical protein Q9159_005764 [Coniocarpon cinnabarinum]